MVNLTGIIASFAKDILQIVRAVLASDAGINRKVHYNTLTTSELFKNLDAVATHDGDLVFDLMLNDYIQYIESGRRQGAKMPPVEPIVKWAKKHGIPTDNSTIFLIRRAIARDGIAPRPILEYVFKDVDKIWDDEWADVLFEEITKIITDFFNS